MTNSPLSIKTEKALAAYVQTILTEGLNFYEGHERAEGEVRPSLIIYARDSVPFPEMPRETATRVVKMSFLFTTDSATGDRVQLDAWKKELEDAMLDVESIQAALNAPVDPEDDERAIKGIHFHDVMMSEDPSDVVQTDWMEDMVFDVVAELLDELTP